MSSPRPPDSERDQRLEQLFQESAQLDPQSRQEFLDGECDSDLELRRQLESLLRYHEGVRELVPPGLTGDDRR